MNLINGILARVFPPIAEPICELGLGQLAMVRGTVVPRDLMDSPLTGERCVYYRYSVRRWRRSSFGGDGFWDIVERDEAIMEFYVEDDSGRAIVAPHSARIDRARRLLPETVELGIDRRAEQVLIEPGDRIEVVAEVAAAKDLFDEGRSYRTRPDRLILQAPEHGHVRIRLLAKRAGQRAMARPG